MIKIRKKRWEEIRRDLRRDLRKCGTVCPRRILDKIDKRGEGRKRISKKVRNNMSTQNLRETPKRVRNENKDAIKIQDPQESAEQYVHAES